MRTVLSAAALALTAISAAGADQPQQPMPAWMAGAWQQLDGEQWSDEFWTPPRSGLMIGAARIGRGDRLDVYEHTRIVRMPDGTLSFAAQPFGAPPSYFPMVASDATMIEFANPGHDYPQRIRYWREGPLLKARVSMMDGSKAQEWSYLPIGG
jgi:hypothetical protein